MIVLTLGSFDLFHVGHVALLRRCRSLAANGEVIVGLNTDEFIERYKGRTPVMAYDERAAVLQACRYVDGIIPNDQPDGSAHDVISAIDPDAIVVGSDWQERDYPAQLGISREWLCEQAIRIVYLPYTQGISTTEIRARL